MKKYLILLIILIPLMINAQVEFQNPTNTEDFWVLIGEIIDFVVIIALGLGAALYIVAAYFFVTAAGEAEKINTAKKMMIWITIGLFVALLSKAIVVLITEIIV